jgi:hypothetical protein
MKGVLIADMIKKIRRKIDYYLRWKNDVYMSEAETKAFEELLLNSEDEYSLNKDIRSERIIVSLTSFPARFEKLHLVIRSMLMQTMKPDEIILYLDDDVVVNSNEIVEELPGSLKNMQRFGLDIQKRSGRIKPHKKYYYAVKEHPEEIIITIDDDIMYPLNLIEELYKTHIQFPNCVVATRAHRIRFQEDGSSYPYNEWQWAYSKKNRPAMDLLATGCGGVLYPPHCMNEELLNIDLLLELSPTADDLWLKIMQVLNGTKVVVTDKSLRKKRGTVAGTQVITLNDKNVHKNMNDVFWNNLIKHYGLTKKDFIGDK